MSRCNPHPDRKAVFCLPQLPRCPSFTKSGVRKAGYAPRTDTAVTGDVDGAQLARPDPADDLTRFHAKRASHLWRGQLGVGNINHRPPPWSGGHILHLWLATICARGRSDDKPLDRFARSEAFTTDSDAIEPDSRHTSRSPSVDRCQVWVAGDGPNHIWGS